MVCGEFPAPLFRTWSVKHAMDVSAANLVAGVPEEKHEPWPLRSVLAHVQSIAETAGGGATFD